jgi:CDGSH-type Zn-finger protein
MKKNTEFKVFENGPIQVTGNFEIYDVNGEKISAEGDVYLCRCGHSSSKPFCDGSHRKSGFSG